MDGRIFVLFYPKFCSIQITIYYGGCMDEKRTNIRDKQAKACGKKLMNLP